MPDHFYVYPAYLDRANPRSMGRRVAGPDAPTDVTLDEIVAAAQALGATAKAEPEKQYPRTFYTYGGRVKVTKRPGVAKSRFLHDLAREIVKRRPAAKKG
ncbi:MAG TPA: signal recognition particle subunit SRP19/SEC65 family protein [Thermoplasmata archaeon]